MPPRVQRAFYIAGGILLVIALVMTLTKDNGDQGEERQAQPLLVTVRDGKPVGGVRSAAFTKGETVTITVDSDVRDELHVHGYDKRARLTPGAPTTISFPARLEGRFEVELERRAVPVLRLEVRP